MRNKVEKKKSTNEMILEKLDIIVGLLAIQGKDEDKKINILKSLGFTYKQVSELTGIPEGTLKSRDHIKRKSKK